jgi:hypothetical protein
MKKLIFALFSLLVLAISCKKDDEDPVATPLPYMNMNSGTTWYYDISTTDTSGNVTTVADTATVGVDTSINSKTYKIVNHTSGAASYYNLTGNDYYQFQNLPAPLNTAVEALYLKDNVGQGTSWTQTVNVDIGGVPLPITLTYTLTEKDITKTVNGISYPEVIGVKTDISSSLLPGAISSDIKNYYARGAGLIEAHYLINVTSPVDIHLNTTTVLKRVDLH